VIPRMSELISPGYRETQRVMHQDPRGYGEHGDHWAPTVIDLARRFGAFSILDYGAGQGSLGKALRMAGLHCRDYDPAVPGWDQPPGFADLVVSTDVLEHIEPDRLDAVLAHIRGLARKAVFLVISTRPAQKRLPNGNNAHLIIEGKQWWRARVQRAGFRIRRAPMIYPAKMPGKCWVAVLKP
jgi:hypothetical protein